MNQEQEKPSAEENLENIQKDIKAMKRYFRELKDIEPEGKTFYAEFVLNTNNNATKLFFDPRLGFSDTVKVLTGRIPGIKLCKIIITNMGDNDILYDTNLTIDNNPTTLLKPLETEEISVRYNTIFSIFMKAKKIGSTVDDLATVRLRMIG